MRTTNTRDVPARAPGKPTAEQSAGGAAIQADQNQTQTFAPPAADEQNSSSAADTGAVRPAVTEEKVRELAYQKWQAAGCPMTDGTEFWLEAETELYNTVQAED